MTDRKALPSRASRGSRIHKLIGEEAEADDAFWNQDAWNEEGEDSDYATEAEEEDVVDSDFDEDEDPDEDVHDDEDDEGGTKRKRGRPSREEQARRRAYQEPQQQGAKRPRRAASAAATMNSSLDSLPGTTVSLLTEKPAIQPSLIPYETPKLRQSTAKKSSESSDLRRKILEEAARLAAKAKKPQVVKTRLTQEQLLVEAVRTEVENVQSLNRLERLEEEKKAENVLTPKAPYTGVIMRYHSRIGMPKTITFLNTSSFPAIFDQKQPRKRERLAPKEEPVEEDDEDEDDDEDGGDDDEDDDQGDGSAEDDETRTNTADEDTGST